ncbi:MAG: hypothetical protein KBT11_06110 [Treponema sp.]|nr:hypothetical protein [Candidatus Treponema equifaecale]
MKKLFLIFCFFSFGFLSFAQRVVSPVEGVFSNRQCLVLNLGIDEEAFYTYGETDPLESGFAYDGPVEIEADNRVSLKIAVVTEKSVENYEVKYTVLPSENPFEAGSSEFNFIEEINSKKILVCTGTSSIEIPEKLKFSLGFGEKPFINGTSLSVSPENTLFRYIPCVVTDGKNQWRFVINLKGDYAGAFAKNTEVPFEISDWYTFKFTGKNLIWCIDDGFWSASTEPVFVDRKTAHIVKWQNVAYAEGNFVETFILPPKPKINLTYVERCAVFNLDGDSRYKMSAVTPEEKNPRKQNSGVFTKLVFDAFEGDSISGDADFAVFCDGVYQGCLTKSYEVDKQPPLPPVYVSNEEGFYSRTDVDLKIQAEDGAEVFYAMAGPVELDDGTYSENSDFVKNVMAVNFKPYDSSEIKLLAGKKSAVFYKVESYAVDKAGNKSDIAEYKIIIDEYNYFIDFGTAYENPDGSRSRPFNTLQQILDVAANYDFTHFFVIGTIVFDKGCTELTSNCAFTGSTKAKIIFEPESSLLVKNCSLEVNNCYIEKIYLEDQKSDSRMFVAENAALTFNDCDIFARFSEDGTVFNSENSALKISNGGITVQTPGYGCGIFAALSMFSALDTKFSTISETAVNLSLSESSLELRNSVCKVSCVRGRIIESTNSNLKMTGNSFDGDFTENKKSIKALWKDDKSLIIENSDNIEIGF